MCWRPSWAPHDWQLAHDPHPLTFFQPLLPLKDWSASLLCSPADLPSQGFSNQIPLVSRGNCTFYEKVRLAQGSGARGLLIVSKEALVGPPTAPQSHPQLTKLCSCPPTVQSSVTGWPQALPLLGG